MKRTDAIRLLIALDERGGDVRLYGAPNGDIVLAADRWTV